MNESSLPSMSTLRRRRVFPWLVLAAVAALLGGLVVLVVAKRRRDDVRVSAQELAEAFDEADRLDAGWRLEQIEGRRPALADDANSARCVESVIALLPKDWPADDVDVRPSNRPPIDGLAPEMLVIVQRELDRVGPALAEARKLEKLPEGRFRNSWKPESFLDPVPGLDSVRKCTYLLQWESLRLLDNGDVDGALSCSRSIRNAGRSLDEPSSVAQLIRVAVRAVATSTMERSLAAGVPGPGPLADCQRALAEEDTYPVHLMMRRGERLWMSVALTKIADGSARWSQWFGLFRKDVAPSDDEMAVMARIYKGRVLKVHNQFVEIARRPLHEQRALFEEHSKTALVDLPGNAKELLSGAPVADQKTLESCQRNSATLRCAIAALAAERFRLQRDRWPTSLAELTPDQLAAVPLDPFDGQPLRLRRREDGIVIYSGGPIGRDDGSKIGEVGEWTNHLERGIGFRLWDENRRRFPRAGPAAP